MIFVHRALSFHSVGGIHHAQKTDYYGPQHEKVGQGVLTTVVLLVLALAWGTVLFFWIRSRSRDTFGDSVGLFHRHLHVLERAAPGSFAPANRLRAPDHQLPYAARRRVPPATLPRGVAPRGAVRGSGAQVLAQTRLRQARRRRRDVLFVLVVLVAGTLVVAAVTRSQPAVMAQLATDVAFVGYVALLVRLRNLAAERELKLRVIHPQARQVRTAPAVRGGRRRAVAYGYAASGGVDEYAETGGYAFAPGYGLASGYAMASGPELRRIAAN
jgi:hypothetical protein